jgi:hypothetical protein
MRYVATHIRPEAKLLTINCNKANCSVGLALGNK